ncbi:MAG TPA: FAD-dependent monooxygenase [Planktothrix sp.]|jgi:flavin-dependent dehydrogenase
MTQSIESIAKQRWDLIVIGAGPSGALLSHLVARTGASVLLVDKSPFPRHKVCGSCISAGAVKALEAAGIAKIIVDSGAVATETLALSDSNQSLRLKLPLGYALSRKSLDSAIVAEALRSGAHFAANTTAAITQSLDEHVEVRLKDSAYEANVTANVVVVADGLNGRSLAALPEFDFKIKAQSKFGAGVVIEDANYDLAPGVIQMACTNDGYVGIVRVEHGQLDIAAALHAEFSRRQGGAAPAAASILQRCKFAVPPDLMQAQWHGTELLTRTRNKVAVRRLFVIGDASGYAEPITGEGMAWAMWSAVSISGLILQSIEKWNDHFASRWQEMHTSLIRQRQERARLIASTLDNLPIRSAALALLRSIPSLAIPYLRSLSDYPDPRSFIGNLVTTQIHEPDTCQRIS